MASLLTGTPRLVGMTAPSGTMDAKILVREKVTRVDPVRLARAVAKVWQLADSLVEAQDVTLPYWTIEEVADSDGPVVEVISAVVEGKELINPNPATPRERPRWERKTGTLFLGDGKVRMVRASATNVVAILDSFEGENWLTHIKSPFDPLAITTFHNTLRTLNTGLKGMRFRADGTGAGIVWELTEN
jgi:hypothetical protein